MELLVLHPHFSKFTCADCCKRLYDLETGEPYNSGSPHEPRYIEGPDHKPPCRTGTKCPKGSPEEEHEHELNPRTLAMLRLYFHSQATHGRCLTDDIMNAEINLEMLMIVDQHMQRAERNAESKADAFNLTQALLAVTR